MMLSLFLVYAAIGCFVIGYHIHINPKLAPQNKVELIMGIPFLVLIWPFILLSRFTQGGFGDS